MIFSSIEFMVLMTVVLASLALMRREGSRRNLLLVASYVFYGWWDWRFCGLILASTCLDFVAAQRIEDSEDERIRWRWLMLSISANLGALGVFKYTNFFLESLNQAVGVDLPHLDIVLPVGISFYTFQTMSYSIDVWRGTLTAHRTFRDFALYVAFFPQLVAGPIVRASVFLPQLQEEHPLTRSNLVEGADLFVKGFVKKLLFADTLALIADPVFADPSRWDSPTVWLGVTAYTGQIYYDFSGYSDMAIGVGRMLGYQFPDNFKHPYLSRSVTEFWRRWHITLSFWLRDYLYISLGGNRISALFTYRNLAITMLLGGLWHGASWNFVVWGALHGVALAAHRFSLGLRGRRPDEHGGPVRQVLGWLGTLLFTMVAWVFFRATTMADAWHILEKMLGQDPQGIQWMHTQSIVVLGLAVVLHVGTLVRKQREYRFYLGRPAGVVAAFWALVAVLCFSPLSTSPFLYFQF